MQMHIADTAGEDRHRRKSVYSAYSVHCRNAKGFILVYDITNADTFDNISQWLQDIDEHCECERVKKILVGNKSDLISQRAVAAQDASSFAEKLGIPFLEVHYSRFCTLSPRALAQCSLTLLSDLLIIIIIIIIIITHTHTHTHTHRHQRRILATLGRPFSA